MDTQMELCRKRKEEKRKEKVSLNYKMKYIEN